MARKKHFPLRIETIQSLMIERGMSTEDLAMATELDERNLRKILGGKQNVQVKTLQAIAKALGTRAEALRADVEPASSNSLPAVPTLLPTATEPPALSFTQALSQADACDPVLVDAFMKQMEASRKSFERFKVTHNVKTKGSLISPAEAMRYFASEQPGLIYQWLECHAFMDSQVGTKYFFILVSSDKPLGGPYTVFANLRQSPVIAVRFHNLPVGICDDERWSGVGQQLEKWYGSCKINWYYFRRYKGRVSTLNGKGDLKWFFLKELSPSDRSMLSDSDRILRSGYTLSIDVEAETHEFIKNSGDSGDEMKIASEL